MQQENKTLAANARLLQRRKIQVLETSEPESYLKSLGHRYTVHLNVSNIVNQGLRNSGIVSLQHD